MGIFLKSTVWGPRNKTFWGEFLQSGDKLQWIILDNGLIQSISQRSACAEIDGNQTNIATTTQ